MGSVRPSAPLVPRLALAQMVLTLIVARLTQRVGLAPGPPGVPRPLGMIVNRHEGGAHLRVSLRDGRTNGGTDLNPWDSHGTTSQPVGRHEVTPAHAPHGR